MTTRVSINTFLAIGFVLAVSGIILVQGQDSPATSIIERPADVDELKKMLQARYDGQTVVAMVPGLYAGEQKKGAFGVGRGENALMWNHYHNGVEVPERIPTGGFLGKKPSDLHQLDERTFGGLSQGLNVSEIEKGESLKVAKFYVRDDYIEFVLSTTGLGHLRDIDMQRASRRTTTTVSGGQVRQNVEVGGFGMVFRFHFHKDNILKAADSEAVVREIDKYLMPEQEAQATLAAEQTVEIDLGLSEDEVIQRLGQPLRAVRVGNQKSLKYEGMTIVLTDGKVAEVKLQ